VGRGTGQRQHLVCPHRLVDILDLLFSQVCVFQPQLVLDGIVDRPRDTDLARLSQALHPGGDVHAVPVDSPFFLDDIPEVNADTEEHPPVFRQLRVPLRQITLDLHGTVHRIHYAGKLGKNVVTGGIHHVAPIVPNEFCNGRTEQFYGTDGCLLILPHETAVAHHIGTEDGREPACEFLGPHDLILLFCDKRFRR
jgi:hypothetical protein